MSDKREVATDALATLGTIIDDKQKRDAIHLAVIPVIAGEYLCPADNVFVIDDTAYGASSVEQGIGIVDPFLDRAVDKGEHFWLVIYPRTIKSLRHVWTHPDLPDELGTPSVSIDEVPAGIISSRKTESEKWLRKFCAGADCPGYEKVIELIDTGTLPNPDPVYYKNGGTYAKEYLHFNGDDAHGEIPSEFWGHVEIVLGRKVKYHSQYFSCSC